VNPERNIEDNYHCNSGNNIFMDPPKYRDMITNLEENSVKRINLFKHSV